MAIGTANRCNSKHNHIKTSRAFVIGVFFALTFRTEETVPAAIADAFEGSIAAAILTARQRNAAIATFAIKAQLAATLVRSVAVTW